MPTEPLARNTWGRVKHLTSRLQYVAKEFKRMKMASHPVRAVARGLTPLFTGLALVTALLTGTPVAIAWADGVSGARSLRAAVQANTRTIYVTALDDRGNALTDLEAPDFTVKAGGKQLEVVRAERADTPLRIAVIVSDAGTGGFQQGVASFTQKLLDRAEFALISVLTQAEVVTNYSSDSAVLREGVRRLGVRGRQQGAQVMEAIHDVTTAVVREGRRPVILVLRVGVEGVTPLTASDVRERLRKSGALLYVISTASAQRRPPSSARQGLSTEQAQLQDDETATSARNLAQVLGDGSRESGGRHDEIVSTTTVSPAVERIADELLNQYALTCAVPQGVKPNDRLTVSTTRKGVKIQAPARLQ